MNDSIDQNFQSFGVGFRVSAREAQIRDLLPAYLPFDSHLAQAQQSTQAEPEYSRHYIFDCDAGIYLLCTPSGVLRRSDEVRRVLEAFESDAQLFIAEHSPRGIFVHAGVVGWNDGALVFPGRSFYGKSTLVAALLKAGATYYSDEYAIFDADGRLLPYPRDLSMRQELAENRRVHPHELNAQIGETSLPVGAIFVCRFEANAVWNPREISPGEALLALLDNTVAARSRTPEVMQTLKKVVASSPAYQSPRGEAETITAEILK